MRHYYRAFTLFVAKKRPATESLSQLCGSECFVKVRALDTDVILKYMSPRVVVTPQSDDSIVHTTPTVDFQQYLMPSAKGSVGRLHCIVACILSVTCLFLTR